MEGLGVGVGAIALAI